MCWEVLLTLKPDLDNASVGKHTEKVIYLKFISKNENKIYNILINEEEEEELINKKNEIDDMI